MVSAVCQRCGESFERIAGRGRPRKYCSASCRQAADQARKRGGRSVHRRVTTYSMWRAFKNCRRKCKYRYIDCLVPVGRPTVLTFGSAIHEGLATHYGGPSCPSLSPADVVAQALVGEDPAVRQLGHAMIRGYVDHYASEPFEVLSVEEVFRGPIRNPISGQKSRKLELGVKVDALVRQEDGSHWLMEHKTASSIEGSYLERLWADFQIHLYVSYLEEIRRIPIAGVLYNVILKSRIRQKQDETPEDFVKRLAEVYRQPQMYHREAVLISRTRIQALRVELWELCQSFLDAQRRGCWYQNDSYCFYWSRPCEYFPLCRSEDDALVRANMYRTEEPNEELREEE